MIRELLESGGVLFRRFTGRQQSEIARVAAIRVDICQLTKYIDLQGLRELVRDEFPDPSQIVNAWHSPQSLFRNGLQALLHTLLSVKGDHSCQLQVSPQHSDGFEIVTRLEEPCLCDGFHSSTPSLTTSRENALPIS